jgi:type VI secretion system secreted protein VgrG
MATRTNPWSPGAATAWATARPTKAQAPGAQHPQERGEGFELRTDLHGALRAAQGMLLSTEAQANANGGLLDRAQLVSTLEAALELVESLGNYAGQHQGLAHDAGPRKTLTDTVRAMGHGANDQKEGTGPGNEPIIALSAPAGIALASPRSIALGAGEHIDAAAREQVQLTAGEQMLLNAGQGLGTFAQSGDMRHIAHQGQLLLQAQHNSARLEADQSVEISASQQHVLFAAKQHITLLCGGAYVKIADGNIEFGMPVDFIVKAAKHSNVSGAAMSPQLANWTLGSLTLPRALELRYAYSDLKPVANAPYLIQFEDGSQQQGTLDAQGYARIDNPPAPGTVFFGFDQREAFPTQELPANPFFGQPAQSPEQAKEQLERYRQLDKEYLEDNYFPDEIEALADSDYEDLSNDYLYDSELGDHDHDDDDEGPSGDHQELTLTDDDEAHTA